MEVQVNRSSGSADEQRMDDPAERLLEQENEPESDDDTEEPGDSAAVDCGCGTFRLWRSRKAPVAAETRSAQVDDGHEYERHMAVSGH